MVAYPELVPLYCGGSTYRQFFLSIITVDNDAVVVARWELILIASAYMCEFEMALRSK